MLQICATEPHGPYKVKGIRFSEGLYENNTYTRVPMYGLVRPVIETGEAVCSTLARNSVGPIEKAFCC